MKRLFTIALLALVVVPGLAVAAIHKDPPAEPPPSFSSTLAQFISYSDDVQALTSWFETLSAYIRIKHGLALLSTQKTQ